MTARLKPRALAFGAAFLFALLMALPALAADAPAVKRTTGKITALSAASITIQPRNGDAKKFTITAATKISIDGKTADVSALTVGQRVRVNSSDEKTALEISNRVRRPATPPAAEAPAPPAAGAAPAPAKP